jgi:hypothetical protein
LVLVNKYCTWTIILLEVIKFAKDSLNKKVNGKQIKMIITYYPLKNTHNLKVMKFNSLRK